MPKWLRRLSFSTLFLLIVGLVFFVVGRVMESMAEYTQTGQCYRNGSTLSAEELHARVIRNLLTAEMESSERVNEYDTWVTTFLIRKSVTSKDVIDAAVSKSIVDWPKEAAYPLNTDEDIANIDPEFLRGEFSIVQYGAGNVRIIPSRSLGAIDANVARKSLDGKYLVDKQQHGFGLSLFERALGYGNYYFQVEVYSFIDLGCCDSRAHPKPPEWYTQQIISSIVTGDYPVRRSLVISNCGGILHRQIADEVRHLF